MKYNLSIKTELRQNSKASVIMKNKRFVLGDACKSNPHQVIFVRNDSNLKNKMCWGREKRGVWID